MKREKTLKLKVAKKVAKAYSASEKSALVAAAQAAPRSKAVHPAAMLGLHAGLRDKEIRTLRWEQLGFYERRSSGGRNQDGRWYRATNPDEFRTPTNVGRLFAMVRAALRGDSAGMVRVSVWEASAQRPDETANDTENRLAERQDEGEGFGSVS